MAVTLGLCLLAAQPLGAESTASGVSEDFSITYNHAGLTVITIRGGKLKYVWHTERRVGAGELAREPQDLRSYDRHEVEIWLMLDELLALQYWVQQANLGQYLPSYNPPPEEGLSYGEAFRTTLEATVDGATQTVEWTGASDVPQSLQETAGQLIKLCQAIEQQRRGRGERDTPIGTHTDHTPPTPLEQASQP